MNKIIVLENGNGLVTKAFAKQARIFGTPEFKVWQEFLTCYPNAKMEVTPKKSTNKNYKLTYDNMREYIRGHENADDAEKVLAELERQIQLSKVQRNPFLFVAEWFKQTYPSYAKHQHKNPLAENESDYSPKLEVA